MFESMRNLIKRTLEAEQAREALMLKVREATASGSCVILAGTPEGTRVIVVGKPLVLRQAEDILRNESR